MNEKEKGGSKTICYQKSINIISKKQLMPNGFAPLPIAIGLGREGRGRGRYLYGVRSR